MSFVLIVAAILLLAIILWYIQYVYYFNSMWDIPTCKITLPIFGNILELTTVENINFDLHRITADVGNYKTIRFAFGYNYAIVTADPILLEYCITHSNAMDKPNIPYNFFRRWLNKGLFTCSSKQWPKLRKLLTPAFHFNILKQFIEVFDKNALILVNQFNGEVGKDKVKINDYFSWLTLDNLCESAMGISGHVQENRNSDYITATEEMTRIIIARLLNLFKYFDCTYMLTNDYRREKKALKSIQDFTLSVIKSRRIEFMKTSDSLRLSDAEDFEVKKKIPFLDVLLTATLDGKPLSDDDVQQEVDTLMFAGFDTTSLALSFCTYCLSIYPDVQDKVVAEQRSIYKNNPNTVTTYNELTRMRYLEMVIKESLRLYPIVPFVLRKVTENFNYGKYTFKKNLVLGINIFTLHRNPHIYPNPDTFDPERFSMEMQASRHPFAYIPFSAGNRNCIGQKFAMLEMKATLAKLVRAFIFSAPNDYELQLKSGVLLGSHNGHCVKLENRIW